MLNTEMVEMNLELHSFKDPDISKRRLDQNIWTVNPKI